MDHSINLTHDGTLIIRIPKGCQVDKVVVEEVGTDDRRKFVHMPADISDYCDELWKKAYERGKAEGQPRKGKWIDIKHTFMTKCSVCDWINNDDSSYNFCPCCGADMRPQFEEPEINPCRGCEDYDGKGGCKTKGGCAKSRGEEDE